MAQTQPDRTQVRLIITRHLASEVLLLRRDSGWVLPCLELPAGARPGEELAAGVSAKYQVTTYCLRIRRDLGSPPEPSRDRYALMEARNPTDDTPAGTVWVTRSAAISSPNILLDDQSAIRSSFEDLDRYLDDPAAGPFARPAWIDELFGWAQGRVEPLGWRLTGTFQQLNASPTFSLVRLETTGTAIWFKATGVPNEHERGITIALDDLFPGYVPQLLGVHPSWNGWLSQESQGPALDDLEDVGTWTEAATALAELQIASVSHTDVLLESGCRDLRLRQLAEKADPFLSRMSELMAMQTKRPPQILSDVEIRVLGDRLKAALGALEKHQLPITLGHLDPNPQNIICCSPGFCFLDWAEGCVTHPFLTFEYFREHARRKLPQWNTAADELVSAYLRPWQAFFSTDALLQTTAISPLVAIFVYAVSGEKWRSAEIFQNPTLAGHFRSLTRRACREAELLATRNERCLV
jgi:hypothetical protein